ncbi:MAG: NADP-dependent oxidoreductase, partial [Pseudomonadales bacterium]|nr:NADP-dependent oxidoreductase [Pseudomonadales bacterium]
GDAVFGMTPFPDQGGAYSEFAVTRKELLVPAPGSIPVANAGAVPLAALTAWQALFEIGSLQAESKILIHAAAGGVGHFAVQMAKTLDAYVIATASPDNHDFLLELGADEVIDYHSTAFETVCYGLDFVLDNVGGGVGLRSLDVLSSHGQMVTVPTISAQDIIAQGEERGIEVTGLTVHFDAQQLEEIADLIDTEDVKPHISTVFTLAQVQQAHTLAETGRGRGKLLLLP